MDARGGSRRVAGRGSESVRGVSRRRVATAVAARRPLALVPERDVRSTTAPPTATRERCILAGGLTSYRTRLAWATFGGLAAWTLLALFVWLDVPGGRRQQLTLATAVAAFVVYLVEVAYVAYVRGYSRVSDPPGGADRMEAAHPLRTWFSSMALVGAFGNALLGACSCRPSPSAASRQAWCSR
jgi:hypothetical protein